MVLTQYFEEYQVLFFLKVKNKKYYVCELKVGSQKYIGFTSQKRETGLKLIRGMLIKEASHKMSQINSKMQTFTKNFICSNEVTKSYIELAEILVTNYRYGDEEIVFNVAAKRC